MLEIGDIVYYTGEDYKERIGIIIDKTDDELYKYIVFFMSIYDEETFTSSYWSGELKKVS